jgi:hypothetical protein
MARFVGRENGCARLQPIAHVMMLCHDQKETDFAVNDARAMVNMAFGV